MKQALPNAWSSLTWQQLCQVWEVKQRYVGNADVARAAALMALCGLTVDGSPTTDPATGEAVYRLKDADGQAWAVTARGLSHMAKAALPWLDFPYGDPGEKEERDDKGKVVKEGRDPVRGYVSPMRDALMIPIETLKVGRRHFALPQAACNNLTWHQYRALQAIAPGLFSDGITDGEARELQAQFLSVMLTPRSFAILDTAGGSIRLRPHHEYRYNSEQADGLVKFWERRLDEPSVITLFRICFQAYQTALFYYAASYPLLFSDSGKPDTLRDALTGEVGTVNTIMKYAGYAEQQQVYDSNLPFVLDILNTMTKEAKEIEKIKRK